MRPLGPLTSHPPVVSSAQTGAVASGTVAAIHVPTRATRTYRWEVNLCF